MSERAERWLVAGLLGVAVALRVVDLDWVPGINGDEAWYGVQAQELWAGRGMAWSTPTGNPQNPFFIGPVIALAWLPPSLVLLRATAVATGLLLVFLTYRLVPRAFGTGDAHGRAGCLLVAALPVNIGYSRFAWDPCQTTLFSLLALYFALRRRWVALALAFVALVSVHPTNLWTLVPLAGAGLGAIAAHGSAAQRRRDLTLSALLAGVSLAACKLLLVPAGTSIDLSAIGAHLLAPDQLWRFILECGRLLSGPTLYRYVVAPLPALSLLAHDVLFFAVALGALAAGVPGAVRTREYALLGLLAGTLLGALAFYLLLGLYPLAPGRERYALWLVMPALLSLIGLLRHAPRWRLAAPLVAALLLGSFLTHYFVPLETAGSRTHRTFRSRPGEPKALALSAILRDAAGAPEVHIYAEDWWLYWPLRYLGAKDPRVVVHTRRHKQELSSARRLAERGAYLVGFAGGVVERHLPAIFGQKAPDTLAIEDLRGQPLIRIWRRPLGRAAHDASAGAVNARQPSSPERLSWGESASTGKR